MNRKRGGENTNDQTITSWVFSRLTFTVAVIFTQKTVWVFYFLCLWYAMCVLQYSHTFSTIKESPGESKTCTFLVVNHTDQISKIHFFSVFFFSITFHCWLVNVLTGWLVTIDKTNNDVFNKMFSCARTHYFQPTWLVVLLKWPLPLPLACQTKHHQISFNVLILVFCLLSKTGARFKQNNTWKRICIHYRFVFEIKNRNLSCFCFLVFFFSNKIPSWPI